MPPTPHSAILEAIDLINKSTEFVRAVFSGVRKDTNPRFVRIDLRPILIKNNLKLQVETNDGKQSVAKNHNFEDFDFLSLFDSGFANILVEHKNGSIILQYNQKDEIKVSRKQELKSPDLEHDRSKNRLLQADDPFLKAVGISDNSGSIKPSMRDKYRQVDDFLKILVPTLNAAIQAGQIPQPTNEKPLRIVDLGCGNAYLTFAVHQYLLSIGMPILVTGIDIKQQSRDRNTGIAQQLGLTQSITFQAASIADSELDAVDITIALHACDTATDDAIAWGVRNRSKLLLIAPCCHHHLQSQLKVAPEPWPIVLKHGLLAERQLDILTDAFRCQLLKLVGYRTEAVEFVSDEHTPRNLLIRAVRTNAQPDQLEIQRYREMRTIWNLNPFLEDLISEFL
jgi:SAM-dependent methyltransferase